MPDAEPEARRRVRAVVRGRVQGVAFRAHTVDLARRIGATGWVRNRSDGSVEAVFEGAPAQVEAMLAFARQGPRHARVDGLETREEPPEGTRSFEIR